MVTLKPEAAVQHFAQDRPATEVTRPWRSDVLKKGKDETQSTRKARRAKPSKGWRPEKGADREGEPGVGTHTRPTEDPGSQRI